MRIDILLPLNLDLEGLYAIIEQIPDAFTLAGIASLALLLFHVYSSLGSKRSDVNIGYQYELDGTVIRQRNRIDIDLFLYVENKGDLTGKIEFFGIGESVKFKSPSRTTTVSSSELGKKENEIAYHSIDNNILSPGDASPVNVRFKFSEDGQLPDLLSDYDKMQVPWSARVTEADRKYRVHGTAIINCS